MARGLFRKTSFNKIVGAYRSQWKRFWMRLFTFEYHPEMPGVTNYLFNERTWVFGISLGMGA